MCAPLDLDREVVLLSSRFKWGDGEGGAVLLELV